MIETLVRENNLCVREPTDDLGKMKLHALSDIIVIITGARTTIAVIAITATDHITDALRRLHPPHHHFN